MTKVSWFRWGLALWIAFVFVQSLFFKFSNSYETQHIFGEIGDWSGLTWFGHYGGYLIGSAELVAALLLMTSLWYWGAIMAAGIMVGAIIFHLFTPLGVVMPAFNDTGKIIGDDGGTLFIMACLTCCSAFGLVFLHQKLKK